MKLPHKTKPKSSTINHKPLIDFENVICQLNYTGYFSRAYKVKCVKAYGLKQSGFNNQLFFLPIAL